jgi:hypothetical protein
MRTGDLIKAIAADGGARPPPIAARMAVALAFGGVVAGALFVHSLGVRPDVADAMQTWRFVTKLAIVLACFASSLWATVRLAHPDPDRLGVLAVLSLPVAMLAVAIVSELAMSPAGSWPALAVGINSRLCLTFIIVMAVAPLVALLVALRAGAPRSPAIAGAVSGLLAGSLAAVLYAVHCFDDSPLFVALWYVPAIGLVMLAGAVAGSRVLRW